MKLFHILWGNKCEKKKIFVIYKISEQENLNKHLTVIINFEKVPFPRISY